MSLVETFKQLQAAMEPFGIELGRDTLHVWRDRERIGQEPLPEAALRGLIEWAEKRLAERS